jgi:hypothetical protein
MGKFREFLINEDVGLGQLGPRIDQLVNGPGLGTQIGGALASSEWLGGSTDPTASDPQRTGTDLTIPSVCKQGRITTLQLKKNPIYVRLSDGTEAHFSFDEYRRIKGSPEIGKVMTIIFQRHPRDASQQHSKIESATVTD